MPKHGCVHANFFHNDQKQKNSSAYLESMVKANGVSFDYRKEQTVEISQPRWSTKSSKVNERSKMHKAIYYKINLYNILEKNKTRRNKIGYESRGEV